MRRSGLVAIAALVLLAGPGLGAGEEPTMTVAYTYEGAGNLTGAATATCDAYGAVWGSENTLVIEAEGVQLEHVVIWVNRSAVRPGEPEEVVLASPVDYNRTVALTDVANGTYEIRTPRDGVKAFRPWGHPLREDASLTAFFVTDQADWTSVREGLTVAPHLKETPSPGGPQFILNGLGFHDGRYPEGARGWSLQDAKVELNGSATLHLREATVTGPGVALELPPYSTEVSNTSVPLHAVRTTTWRLEEVFLHMEQVKVRATNTDVTVACGVLGGDVEGSVTVLQATGEARAGQQLLPFERQVLSIEGRFRLDESGAERIDATAAGDITVIGLDFKPAVVVPVIGDLAAKVGLAVVVAATAAAIAKKGWPFATVLYNRLRHRNLLDESVRVAILQAVEDVGFMRVPQITKKLGISRGNARHHLDVLVRAGLLREEDLEKTTWYVGPGRDRAALVWFFIHRDERLRAVHERMRAGNERPEVISDLIGQLGVTERTVRKYITRYAALMSAVDDRAAALVRAASPQEVFA